MSTTSNTTAIVALDVPRLDAALALVTRLGDMCRFYKVGSELFTAAGPAAVARIREAGAEVFLDLKFHDIPNTVGSAVRSAVALDVRLVTVHASGGRAMLEAAVEGAAHGTGVLAVTVLTSMAGPDVAQAWGRDAVDSGAEVVRLAGLAASAGAHGVVCAGTEIQAIRTAFGDRLAVLVPGVRLAGDATHDQRRVITPRDARYAGARYIVLGRTVTAAADPVEAMERVLGSLA